jgi:hypothetical protein
MIELDPARPVRSFRYRRLSSFSWRIQQLEHSLSGCHRRLQNVVLLAQILNRTEKPLRVLHKCNQHAQCDHCISREMKRKQGFGTEADHYRSHCEIVQHIAAAKPNHAGDCNGRQDFHHRVINRVRHDRVFEGFHVLRVDFGKFIEGALLAIEKL